MNIFFVLYLFEQINKAFSAELLSRDAPTSTVYRYCCIVSDHYHAHVLILILEKLLWYQHPSNPSVP